MSMKRMLGMMLASRMAGRGMRGGMGRGMGGGGLGGGGLGGLAAAGMLGGRRGGLGQKAGLAALGYMAYRAYQDHQARNQGTGAGASGNPASAAHSGGGHTGGAATGSGIGGALGGIMQSVSDALGGGSQGSDRATADVPGARHSTAGPAAAGASSEAGFSPEDERAAEAFSEDTALLLVRAMVTAANADGTIAADERSRIMSQADEAGADAEDKRVLERELANPRPLEELLGQVSDHETVEEFYLASLMAVDDGTEANRAYLLRLRERLGLAEQQAADIDTLAS